jgi:hypothetical protein
MVLNESKSKGGKELPLIIGESWLSWVGSCSIMLSG